MNGRPAARRVLVGEAAHEARLVLGQRVRRHPAEAALQHRGEGHLAAVVPIEQPRLVGARGWGLGVRG